MSTFALYSNKTCPSLQWKNTRAHTCVYKNPLGFVLHFWPLFGTEEQEPNVSLLLDEIVLSGSYSPHARLRNSSCDYSVAVAFAFQARHLVIKKVSLNVSAKTFNFVKLRMLKIDGQFPLQVGIAWSSPLQRNWKNISQTKLKETRERKPEKGNKLQNDRHWFNENPHEVWLPCEQIPAPSRT